MPYTEPGRRESAIGRLQALSSARGQLDTRYRQKAEDRYNEYMEDMQRREEEAKRKSEGSFFGNVFGGAAKGALTGALMGGPMGALAGAGIGAGAGGIGYKTGAQEDVRSIGNLAMGAGGMMAAGRIRSGQPMFGGGAAASGAAAGSQWTGPSMNYRMGQGSMLPPGATWMG